MERLLTKKRVIIILAILIAVQLCYITYIFGWVREGMHSDEPWIYGFANAYYEKSLYLNEDGSPKNFDEWLSSDKLRDYIQVNEGEEFSYGAVYYNSSMDNNTPLHHMILHTVCSFFPETFSWWYSYVINAVCFVFTMIFLYLFVYELRKSRFVALATCFMYGSVTAACSTTIFLRTYALITTFTLIYSFLHARLYNRDFETKKRVYVGIFLLNVLGGLSHFYYLLFSFFLGVCFLVYLGVRRKWKKLLGYGATLLMSAVAFVAVYPNSMYLIKRSSKLYVDTQMPLVWEIKTCIRAIVAELTGFIVKFPDQVTWTILAFVLIFSTIIISGVSFILRNEIWFRRFVKKIWNGIRNFFERMPARLRAFPKIYILFAVAIALCVVLIAKISNIFLMGACFDRYLFHLMPLVSVYFVLGVYKLLRVMIPKHTKKQKVMLMFVVIICIVCSQVRFPSHYLFKRDCDKTTIAELTKDADVVLALDSNWHLVCYPPLLLESNQFFCTMITDLEKNLESLSKTEKDSPVYLIIESERLLSEEEAKKVRESGEKQNGSILSLDYTLNEIVDQCASVEWVTMREHIQTEHSFQGKLDVFRLR